MSFSYGNFSDFTSFNNVSRNRNVFFRLHHELGRCRERRRTSGADDRARVAATTPSQIAGSERDASSRHGRQSTSPRPTATRASQLHHAVPLPSPAPN